jgi:hypothetical protein
MTVEVLSAPVIDRGRPRIGVPCGDLDITQRDAGVEGRMMKAERSMCGWTEPRLARLPMDWTQR